MKYSESGVDIKKADMLTAFIKDTVNDDNIGNFAGLYSHPVLPDHYLVACTDGVGTKILPLIEYDLVETVAIDLIAMNLNDMICTGARPLFFLDYFATHTLNLELTSRFIKALKLELSKYNCTLLGGETAELKGLVNKDCFDVGGFALGLVEKTKTLTSKNVSEGDVIIGLTSSGPHSNGFTLIRKLHETGIISNIDIQASLSPTKIYINEILQLCNNGIIKACAHITGGGLFDNLKRVIPDGLKADIDLSAIPEQPLFTKIKNNIGHEEAFKTFNMGVGMCIITSYDYIEDVNTICNVYNPFLLGKVEISNSETKVNMIKMEE